MEPRRRIKIALLLLTTLAFGLRLGWIIHSRAWINPNAMEHRAIARYLVSGDGFSFTDWKLTQHTSVQSPPYPLLVAGLFKLCGTEVPPDGSLRNANLAFFLAMLLNSLVAAGTVPLTYSLARTLGGNERTGLLAATMVAFWPGQIYLARHVQAVALITAAVCAMVILFYRATRGGRVWPWIGYSVIGALAALTEPVFLPALFLSGILILIWRELALADRLRNAVILMVVTAAIIGPWSMRNRAVHGKWVPIKSTFWVNVWKGNNDHATGTDRLALGDEARTRAEQAGVQFDDQSVIDPRADAARQYDLLSEADRARLTGQPEIAREAIFKELATEWIRNHPMGYLRLCEVRLVKTLTVDWDNPKSYNVIYIFSRYVLLTLSAIGLMIAIKRRWALVLPLVLVGTALATYTLTVTAARFALPFEPLQLCFAAVAILAFFECLIPSARRPLAMRGTTNT